MRASSGVFLALATAARAADDLGPPELPGEPLRTPFPWEIALPVTALVVALVVLAAIARSRRKAEPAPPTAPDEPDGPTASQRALSALDALRERACDTPGDVDAFHDEIAAVLRAFVAEHYDVPGRQTTTEEFAAGLRDRVPAATVSGLVAVLRRSDMARFARSGSSAEARSALVHDAATVVRSAGARAP